MKQLREARVEGDVCQAEMDRSLWAETPLRFSGSSVSSPKFSPFAVVFPIGSLPLSCHTLSPPALGDQAGPQGASLKDSV